MPACGSFFGLPWRYRYRSRWPIQIAEAGDPVGADGTQVVHNERFESRLQRIVAGGIGTRFIKIPERAFGPPGFSSRRQQAKRDIVQGLLGIVLLLNMVADQCPQDVIGESRTARAVRIGQLLICSKVDSQYRVFCLLDQPFQPLHKRPVIALDHRTVDDLTFFLNSATRKSP